MHLSAQQDPSQVVRGPAVTAVEGPTPDQTWLSGRVVLTDRVLAFGDEVLVAAKARATVTDEPAPGMTMVVVQDPSHVAGSAGEWRYGAKVADVPGLGGLGDRFYPGLSVRLGHPEQGSRLLVPCEASEVAQVQAFGMTPLPYLAPLASGREPGAADASWDLLRSVGGIREVWQPLRRLAVLDFQRDGVGEIGSSDISGRVAQLLRYGDVRLAGDPAKPVVIPSVDLIDRVCYGFMG